MDSPSDIDASSGSLHPTAYKRNYMISLCEEALHESQGKFLYPTHAFTIPNPAQRKKLLNNVYNLGKTENLTVTDETKQKLYKKWIWASSVKKNPLILQVKKCPERSSVSWWWVSTPSEGLRRVGRLLSSPAALPHHSYMRECFH